VKVEGHAAPVAALQAAQHVTGMGEGAVTPLPLGSALMYSAGTQGAGSMLSHQCKAWW